MSVGCRDVPRISEVGMREGGERGKVEKEGREGERGDEEAERRRAEGWAATERSTKSADEAKGGGDENETTEWVRSAVLGGVDGIITSFVVVSGGRGAGLSPTSTLAVGFASLLADGLSMAVSELNSVRSPFAVAAFQAAACMLSFVAAGSLPLLSFLAAFSLGPDAGTGVSAAVAAVELFGIGAARSWARESRDGDGPNGSGSAWRRRMTGGFLTLGTGAIAGAAAYGVATGISGIESPG